VIDGVAEERDAEYRAENPEAKFELEVAGCQHRASCRRMLDGA
jgi:hypothetical protein